MIEESWVVGHINQAIRYGATTAIDIGANVGEFTRLFARQFQNVIAVEPDPRAFAELQSTVPKSVLCQHAAITAINGGVDFHLRPNTVQSSLLLDHPVGAGDQHETPIIETIGVNGLTLDFLLFTARERLGDLGTLFVKVDVEGSEGDVLAGATDEAFRRAAWLIEVHDREHDVGVGLRDLGFDGLSVTRHPYASAHPRHFWVYTHPDYRHPNAT